MPDDRRVLLDGSTGEGGGQILRTALALSLITGRPFELVNVRARRPDPGLRPQHLACVRAAVAVSGATAEGAELGSRRIRFDPGAARAGDYLLDVGTAGAVTLLFHALCFPLALCGGTSTLKLRGGTHVRASPPFHYLSLVWEPAMRALGYDFALELDQAGFYPEGGGEVTARVRPAGPPVAWDGRSRGMLVEAQVLSLCANLPFAIAERQSGRALARLRERGIHAQAETLPLPGRQSRGSMCLVVGVFERTRVGYSALGEKGKPAETVAEEAATAFGEFMAAGGALDEHMGDQVLLPLALAAAGRPDGEGMVSRFTTRRITDHLVTNAEVIGRFLEVETAVFGRVGVEGEVRVAPRGRGIIEALRPS